ncbi:transposable element Tc1 transposase [Trichonephila clavipes]|nr:transposable element Tc1 transposase [Trichonephila clavipes]
MAALWRATGWYKRQQLDEESPAKPFRDKLILTYVRITLVVPAVVSSSGLKSGHGCLVVKFMNSWLACQEFEPCSAEEHPCRGAMHVKSIEAQTSSSWCGGEKKQWVHAKFSSRLLPALNTGACRNAEKPFHAAYAVQTRFLQLLGKGTNRQPSNKVNDAQRRQLDMFTKGRIVGMLESSRSQSEVSHILNVDQSVISRLWQKFQRTGDVTRQPASSRPRVTTPRQDR